MLPFKNITYSKMLYETLRNYHSVTKVYFDEEGNQQGGLLSDLYKYCLACLYVLQAPWNAFNLWRRDKLIIASCKWQIGQVTNVLNHFFDAELSRIFITQRKLTNLFAPVIDGNESLTYGWPIDIYESEIFAPVITDTVTLATEVSVHVPASIFTSPSIMNSLIAIIEQIKITGINYQIIEI
jgi:hypothetical protein